jgi:integrase
MPAKSDRTKYLRRIGEKWYVSVRVPRSLEKALGTDHIRRTLHTGDLAEANRLKLAEVVRIKAELDALRRKQAQGEPIKRGLTLADASAIRADLQRARKEGDEHTEEVLLSHASERAHDIAALHGESSAHRWVRRATRTEATLDTLCERWLKGSDYKGVTQDAHREALRGLLAFLGDDEATPLDVSRVLASDYIDADLAMKGLAQKTMRRKINSLSAFWDWLEVKGLAPPQGNPWRGHKISAKAHKGTRPKRRNYEDAELVALMNGAPAKGKRVSKTRPIARDLAILGLFSGARIDELCTLRAPHVTRQGGGYVVRVEQSKTQAGERPIAFVHAAPCAILARRLKVAGNGGALFPELKPGGIDDKLSHEASKAFGRYRRACGVPDGPDFHSFRRQVATVLERAGVPTREIDRFIGHKIGRLSMDTYSAGSDAKQALATARKIRYTREIEAAALKAAKK